MVRSTIGAGMLVIWHDAVPGQEIAIEHWYNNEHHFERLDIPGFCEATRYQALDRGSRRYMCLYRTTNPEVLSAPIYLARVNDPTRWTKEIMPLYRNFSRTVCRITHTSGRACGGSVAVLAVVLNAVNSQKLQPDLIEKISVQLLSQPGVLCCRWLAQADHLAVQESSTESQLRGRPDQRIDVAILIDTNVQNQANDALTTLETLLKEASVTYDVHERGSYQQVFSANTLDRATNVTEEVPLA